MDVAAEEPGALAQAEAFAAVRVRSAEESQAVPGVRCVAEAPQDDYSALVDSAVADSVQDEADSVPSDCPVAPSADDRSAQAVRPDGYSALADSVQAGCSVASCPDDCSVPVGYLQRGGSAAPGSPLAARLTPRRDGWKADCQVRPPWQSQAFPVELVSPEDAEHLLHCLRDADAAFPAAESAVLDALPAPVAWPRKARAVVALSP